jgi:hypothetical protein
MLMEMHHCCSSCTWPSRSEQQVVGYATALVQQLTGNAVFGACIGLVLCAILSHGWKEAAATDCPLCRCPACWRGSQLAARGIEAASHDELGRLH